MAYSLEAEEAAKKIKDERIEIAREIKERIDRDEDEVAFLSALYEAINEGIDVSSLMDSRETTIRRSIRLWRRALKLYEGGING